MTENRDDRRPASDVRLSPPWRVSANRFLNALPLTWSLIQNTCPTSLVVTEDFPAGNAEALATYRAEAALLPSIEYQRIPGLQVVGGAAITSAGPVRSVLLVTRRDPRELRSVGVTQHSRTSVVLLQILLRRKFGINCPFLSFDQLEAAQATHDGVLIIGDQAMTRRYPGYRVFDLALWWSDFTGHPFVFAFWAVRRECSNTPLPRLLRDAAAEGVRKIPDIAIASALRLGLPEADVMDYLRNCLKYRFGEVEKRSLELFYRMAAEDGHIPKVRPLDFLGG